MKLMRSFNNVIFLPQVISSPQSVLHPIYIRPSHHLQALRHLETTAAKAASQADPWLTSIRPQIQNLNNKKSITSPHNSWYLCVCVRMIICPVKHLKIRPFKDVVSAFGLCECEGVCERGRCVCGRLSAGPVCQPQHGDEDHKSSHVFNPRQDITNFLSYFAYKCGLKMFLKPSKKSCSVCLSAFERLVVCLVVCEWWRWMKVQVCSNLTWNVNKTWLTVTPNILYVFIWTVTHSNLIIEFYLKILCNKHTNHSILEGTFLKHYTFCYHSH